MNKLSVYPVVGQIVNVLHKAGQDRAGNVRIIGAGREVRKVAAVFIIDEGLPSVRDSVGDVWQVKPSKLGQWETVA